MGGIGVFQILFLFLLMVPLFHVLASPRSQGGARFGWAVLMVFFSWLAYPVFLIVTQKEANKHKAGSSKI